MPHKQLILAALLLCFIPQVAYANAKLVVKLRSYQNEDAPGAFDAEIQNIGTSTAREVSLAIPTINFDLQVSREILPNQKFYRKFSLPVSSSGSVALLYKVSFRDIRFDLQEQLYLHNLSSPELISKKEIAFSDAQFPLSIKLSNFGDDLSEPQVFTTHGVAAASRQDPQSTDLLLQIAAAPIRNNQFQVLIIKGDTAHTQKYLLVTFTRAAIVNNAYLGWILAGFIICILTVILEFREKSQRAL